VLPISHALGLLLSTTTKAASDKLPFTGALDINVYSTSRIFSFRSKRKPHLSIAKLLVSMLVESRL
jgi:hypothetical protein